MIKSAAEFTLISKFFEILMFNINFIYLTEFFVTYFAAHYKRVEIINF